MDYGVFEKIIRADMLICICTIYRTKEKLHHGSFACRGRRDSVTNIFALQKFRDPASSVFPTEKT